MEFNSKSSSVDDKPVHNGHGFTRDVRIFSLLSRLSDAATAKAER